MAATASPRFDPTRSARLGADEGRAALARFLAIAADADTVDITNLTPLRGGAIQENWAVDARFSNGPLAGSQRLVLRTTASTGVAASLSRVEEFAVVKAAFDGGVTVPEPLFATEDKAVF